MKAINKTYQSKVNRAINNLIKYNSLNDLRNAADGNCDEKEYRKLDKQCIAIFDKYLEIVLELPKRERQQIEKSELY
jgi:hypothetical protein